MVYCIFILMSSTNFIAKGSFFPSFSILLLKYFSHLPTLTGFSRRAWSPAGDQVRLSPCSWEEQNHSAGSLLI